MEAKPADELHFPKCHVKVIIPVFDLLNYVQKDPDVNKYDVDTFMKVLWEGRRHSVPVVEEVSPTVKLSQWIAQKEKIENNHVPLSTSAPISTSPLSKKKAASIFANSFGSGSPLSKFKKSKKERQQFTSVLYHCSNKSSSGRIGISKEIEISTLIGMLDQQDWLEMDYTVLSHCWIIEGFQHKINIVVSFLDNQNRVLLFDKGVTVNDAIQTVLDSLGTENQNNYIYELGLYNKENAEFIMESERLLASFNITRKDELRLHRRRKDSSPPSLSSSLEVSLTSSLSDQDIKTFRLSVLFPDLQIYNVFMFNSNQTVQEAKKVIINRMKTHPTFNALIEMTEEEEKEQLISSYVLSIPSITGDSSQNIFLNNSKTLAEYKLYQFPTIEFTMKQSAKIIILDPRQYSVEVKFPGRSAIASQTMIFDGTVRVKKAVAILKSMLRSEVRDDSLDSYGLFMPPSFQTEFSEWLKDERLIDSYELDLQGVLEFKEDPTYQKIMQAAAKAFSVKPDPMLLEGENIVMKRDHTSFIISNGSLIGTVYLTNYRVLFIAQDRSTYDETEDVMEVPIATIDNTQEFRHSENFGVILNCKDWKVVMLAFLYADVRNQFLKHIKDMTAVNQEKLFAFFNREKLPVDNGWDVYDPYGEYCRQGAIPSAHWRLTDVNRMFKLCPTYPARFLVPNSVSDDDLMLAASYRSRGRIPAVVWVHPHNNASLTRCAQPKTGLTRQKNAQDEAILSSIMKSSTNSSTLYVMDSRPLANAVANAFMGKGVEATDFSYQHCKIKFLGVGNIHVMSDSFKKLRDLCQTQNQVLYWLSELESTQWLENISQILSGVISIVELIDKGCSVVTHCSDGWDRTAQLCAIAQILLDPYYRTYVGFECLIEKEWLSFGHKFQDRYGIGPRIPTEESPIFIQFIDIVWQIQRQFPCSFQFNERFLITILDHLHSSRFGTFLGNCEKDRLEMQLNTKTVSLWSFIHSNIENYLNPHFTSNSRIIYPVAEIKKLQLWTNYYMRWDKKMKDQESIEKKTRQIREKCDQLQHQLKELEKQKRNQER